jgi:hypothetical protein
MISFLDYYERCTSIIQCLYNLQNGIYFNEMKGAFNECNIAEHRTKYPIFRGYKPGTTVADL